MRVTILLVISILLASPLQAALDLDTGEGALAAFRKIQCSTVDGDARTYWWHGRAYSRVPGEKDKLLFRVEGMNIRQCVTVEDPELGAGVRLVTREILLYQDPRTGEVLRSWRNPWTGKTVEVIHVANDPVNNGPFFAKGRDGREFPFMGTIKEGMWWSTSTIPLFYNNPLAGDFQDYVGGAYHATEMFNFMGDLDDLVDETKPSADVRVGWVRLAQWLPWMEMGSRPGVMYMHTAGKKLESFDGLSEVMKREIAENYPEYNAPPPADDTRPNETSWTYFKKVLSERGGPESAEEGGH